MSTKQSGAAATASRQPVVAALSVPKRNGRTIPEDTELHRLTARAWVAYLDQVNARSLLPLGAPSAEEGTSVRDGHRHQLLRAVSFALTAGTTPEDISDNERDELHQVFGPEHPGASHGGHMTSAYNWHEDKHPDALALYTELRELRHL